MRGGKVHELIDNPDPPERRTVQGTVYVTHPRYCCRVCGDHFQVRSSAPSCTIDFIQQIEQAAVAVASSVPKARDDLELLAAIVDPLIRKRYHWKKPQREQLLENWKRWRRFKARQATGVQREIQDGAALLSAGEIAQAFVDDFPLVVEEITQPTDDGRFEFVTRRGQRFGVDVSELASDQQA